MCEGNLPATFTLISTSNYDWTKGKLEMSRLEEDLYKDAGYD